MSIREQFNRTVCDCERCSRFCRTIPGVLAPGDPDLIAKYLGIPLDEMKKKLLASPGAVVRNQDTGAVYRIPTIVPDRDANGVCTFLDQATGHCTIHSVSPFGCAYCDDHMPREEGDLRSRAVLIEICESPDYQRLWHELWDTGRRSPAPETLRAKG